MKQTLLKAPSLFSLASLIVLGTSASAITWDGGSVSVDTFTAGTNWVGDSAPSAAAYTAFVFTGSTRLTPTLNGNPSASSGWNVSSITFDSGASAFNISSAGEIYDRFRTYYNIDVGVTQNSAANQRISAQIALSTDSSAINTVSLDIDGTGTGSLTLDDVRISQIGLSEINVNRDAFITNVTGTASATGTTNYSVAADTKLTVTGSLDRDSDSHSINKQGAGTMELQSASTDTITTTVQAGTLLVSNSTGSATGTGALTVNDGAILGGMGQIALAGTNAVTVNTGGIISAGDDASLGTLSFDFGSTTGGLDMADGSSFVFELGSSNTSDSITFLNFTDGDLSLTGDVDVAIVSAQEGTYNLFEIYSDGGSTLYTGSLDISSLSVLGDSNFGYALSYGSGLVTLDVTAIPEPSTTVCLLGITSLLCFWVRRRNKA